ncbi:hypothetical protein BGZ60DRAFT_471767 [Tricladium varicosporioides]|nr:hypothetical protein BGZ60DRAFT_471767 [Hymenoscyphus varicosporioides]
MYELAGGSIATSPPELYKVSEAPLGTARHVRIITIGAGASGINMIRTLQKKLTNYEHIVYEKNPSVGGTWYENRYPGCQCDIPAHNYQFSWKHNPSWSTFFASAPEIESYLCRICDEENMYPSIKTSHQVTSAIWNESESQWELKIQNLKNNEIFTDSCHFLLNAAGILNNWKWPDIKGLHDFRGDLLHTAAWPEGYQYADKKVAVIGNGSSGVQVVPAIQPDVQELVHFIRSPLWVTPTQQQMIARTPGNILESIEMDGDKFTPAQIEKFNADPEYYLKFVKAVEEDINNKFPLLIKDSPTQKYAQGMLTQFMAACLDNDERLIKLLIPSFPVGCRRLTPAVGYLQSLTRSNVRVVSDQIVEVVPNGIKISTGEVIEVDALVCATGFDVSFCPRFPVVGRHGNLQDLWKKETPRAYMSSSVPNFPNYFMFLGPNAPIGHGSVFTITEHVATYICTIIAKCQTESILSISPTPSALSDFSEHINAFMPRTAWSGSCRSWFKDGKEEGPVTALHPGSRIHWFHMLERFRGEDFEYVREAKNRFKYLGNGFSTMELGQGDKTWYLGGLKEV